MNLIRKTIKRFRFTVAVRAPWLKKYLKLKCSLTTVIHRRPKSEGRRSAVRRLMLQSL